MASVAGSLEPRAVYAGGASKYGGKTSDTGLLVLCRLSCVPKTVISLEADEEMDALVVV